MGIFVWIWNNVDESVSEIKQGFSVGVTGRIAGNAVHIHRDTLQKKKEQMKPKISCSILIPRAFLRRFCSTEAIYRIRYH